MTEGPCQICGTRHGLADCPGELRPTGPERHGWSLARATRTGLEGCGVLLAPCTDLWRARILTFPTVLWMSPGGRGGTLKFSGRYAVEAERQAILEIQRTPPWTGVQAEAYVAAERRNGRRHRKSLPIRFGTEKTDRFGTTLNLSPAGLFLSTPSPLDPGTEIRMEVELFGSLATLHGTVTWVRERLEPARPRGMGVRLVKPPAVYAVFVHRLP